MSVRFACLNGRILPLAEARVSVVDRGLLYGDGLFETIRVVGGACIGLARHVARLHSGARTLGFPQPLCVGELAGVISLLLDANGLADARARLTLTRGVSSGPGRLAPSGGAEPTMIITTDPLPKHVPEPARVVVSSIRRDEMSPLCSVKSTSYLPGILARIDAERAGADDALLLNTRGKVAEGTVANLFLVRGRTLVTPSLDQGVLPGTARAAVIELAPGLGLEAVEAEVDPGELIEADELFFTNAIQLTRQIRGINGTDLSGGHEVAAQVREALLRAR